MLYLHMGYVFIQVLQRRTNLETNTQSNNKQITDTHHREQYTSYLIIKVLKGGKVKKEIDIKTVR